MAPPSTRFVRKLPRSIIKLMQAEAAVSVHTAEDRTDGTVDAVEDAAVDAAVVDAAVDAAVVDAAAEVKKTSSAYARVAVSVAIVWVLMMLMLLMLLLLLSSAPGNVHAPRAPQMRIASVDRIDHIASVDRPARPARPARLAVRQLNAIAPPESRLQAVLHAATTHVKSLALHTPCQHPLSMLEGIQSYVTHYVHKLLALPHGMPANALPSASPTCDEDGGDWF